MTNRTRVFFFRAVGWDKFRPHAGTPDDGTRVVKVQPAGTPRNGTMGHCFVADADTGEFCGLVLLTSLVATKEMVVRP